MFDRVYNYLKLRCSPNSRRLSRPRRAYVAFLLTMSVMVIQMDALLMTLTSHDLDILVITIILAGLFAFAASQAAPD